MPMMWPNGIAKAMEEVKKKEASDTVFLTSPSNSITTTKTLPFPARIMTTQPSPSQNTNNVENNEAPSPTLSQQAIPDDDSHLLQQAAVFPWALQPRDSLILDTALRNSQALLLHLQNSHLYYSANLVRSLCNQHHLFNDPSLIPVDQGAKTEAQSNDVQEYHNKVNGIASKIKFLKGHMKALDAHCERRGAFPLRRKLTSANYLHNPYFVDSSRASRTKEYVDQYRTSEERAQQERVLKREEEERRQPQSQHSSPQHQSSPRTQRYSGIVPDDEQCYDHEDPGFIMPHRLEDFPKTGKRVQRNL
jgi:hypothetical protein